MEASKSIMCPSYRCKPGSGLLGIRQENGRIAILPQILQIDEKFLVKAKENLIPPEQRFRFSNKCIEKGCKQWNGQGCDVVERVAQFLNIIPEEEGIPKCSIRGTCRWHLQKGEDACKICPYVLTEITGEEMKNKS